MSADYTLKYDNCKCSDCKNENTEECEHEFVKLNETQIFCKFCGEIRGPKSSPCVHYNYCTCNHRPYYPPYITWSASGWGTYPYTITTSGDTKTVTL